MKFLRFTTQTLIATLCAVLLVGTVVFAQTVRFPSTAGKGVLVVGSTTSLYARLVTSTNGYVLTISSTAPYGISWEPSAGGGSVTTSSAITAFYFPYWATVGGGLSGSSTLYQSGSNLGVATTQPSSSLHVVGTGRFTGALAASSTFHVEGVLDSRAGLTFVNATGTGNLEAATAKVTGNLTTNISGSSQCVQADSNGILSGTGSSCGGSGAAATVSLLTGEALSAMDAVYVTSTEAFFVNQTSSATQIHHIGTASQSGTAGDAVANLFTSTNTVVVSGAYVDAYKNNSPTGNLILGIKALSGGKPSGDFLASGTTPAAGLGASCARVGVSFSANYTMTAGTQYAWIASSSNPASDTDYLEVCNASTSVGGTFQLQSGSWATTTPANGFDFAVTQTSTHVFRTSSGISSTANPFIGFVTAAAIQGTSTSVTVLGSLSGFSSLTPGSFYYLNAANGSIGTTAGATTRKVGIALTSSTLLIANQW